MSVAEQATKNTGFNLNLFDLEPAIPDANTLLSLKMLKEANPVVFKGLAEESTRFLSAALGLVRQDDFLRIKLGGNNITAAMRLAPILKQRAEEQHIKQRIDATAHLISGSAFAPGLSGMSSALKPGKAGVSLVGANGRNMARNPSAATGMIYNINRPRNSAIRVSQAGSVFALNDGTALVAGNAADDLQINAFTGLPSND